MDWFFALESPTQVAIIGVIGGVLTAFTAALVAAINANKPGKGPGTAEIAALTIDTEALRQIAAAIEALNVSMIQQNRIAETAGPEAVQALDRMRREMEELRRELRALTDRMPGRG